MDLFNGRKETTGQAFELFFYLPGKGCMVSLASRNGKNCERVESELGGPSAHLIQHTHSQSHLGVFECIQLHARTKLERILGLEL